MLHAHVFTNRSNKLEVGEAVVVSSPVDVMDERPVGDRPIGVGPYQAMLEDE